MMEMFYSAWEKTCSDVDNEQTFTSNKMTLVFDGSEEHLASKKLMDLVEEQILLFWEQLSKSTAPTTIKELRSKITKPEGVRYNPKRGEAPIGSNTNDEVSKKTTTNVLPSVLSCNLDILNEIDQITKKAKKLTQTN